LWAGGRPEGSSRRRFNSSVWDGIGGGARHTEQQQATEDTILLSAILSKVEKEERSDLTKNLEAKGIRIESQEQWLRLFSLLRSRR